MKAKTMLRGKKAICAVAAIVLAGSIAATGLTYPTVSASADEPGKWFADFASFEEEQEYAGKLNEQIMEEGAVLLKNNNNTLPLSKNERNITLFGQRSYDPVTGGTGSGVGTGDYITIPESLEAAGFNINSKVRAIYEGNPSSVPEYEIGYKAQTVESDISLMEGTESSFLFYGDAAIMTISRTGGETEDLYQYDLSTHSDKTEHYLELDDNEKDLIKFMKQNFNKVIVLINAANPMELGILEDDDSEYAVDAILWIGQPGNTGLNAIGRILNGEVNPSGRLVDIYTRDFKKDPTWQNSFDLSQNDVRDPVTGEVTGDQHMYTSYYVDENGEIVEGQRIIEYEEGIYLGYKYYETRAAEYNGPIASIGEETFENGEEWYQDAVVYPFGYGMSYTTFSQELVTTADQFKSDILAKGGLDDEVRVEVQVTNTGSVTGKDVVQLYISAPYYEGEIEKAEVQLVGFAKTPLLAPGESATVTVDVRLGDIASFDYNDANDNDYKGWEIEAGDYELRLQKNSHEMWGDEKLSFNIADGEALTTSLDNDSDATNNTPLSSGDDYDSLLNTKTETVGGKDYKSTMVTMTRSDMEGTFPTVPLKDDMTFGTHLGLLLSAKNEAAGTSQTTGTEEGRYTGYYNSSDDKTTDPWYVASPDDINADWTQATEEDVADRVDGKVEVLLGEMAGIDYWDDETVIAEGPYEGMTGAEAWTEFMNQLTWDEVKTVISNGSFGTPAMPAIGKEAGKDQDGPAQLKSNGTYWCCEVVISSTWNVDLAYEQGVCVGNESLFQDVTGWYGAAMNIHRTPFSGRNFEYYSQDALQGGRMAAAVIGGAQSKGLNCYIKHFAVNDQERGRGNLGTFASEQAIRENYLKNFEYAFKFGGSTGVMVAYNRVGAINEFGNWATNVQILRNEWGFKGVAITDAYGGGNVLANMMQRGGVDMPLGSYGGENSISGTWDATLRGGKGDVRDGNADAQGVVPESPTQYQVIRDSATRTLWVFANTNINENGLDKSSVSYDDEITWYAGIDGGLSGITPVSFAVDTDKYGTKNVSYDSEGLPEGLSISANGNLVGTTMELGTYDVDVTVIGDGWSRATAPAKVTIRSLYDSSNGMTAKVGEEFNTTLEQVYFEIGDAWDGGDIRSFAYRMVSGEVPGLTLGADGTLSGTPTEAGEYTMTIRTTITYFRGRNRTVTFDSVLPFVVTDESAASGSDISFRVENGELQYSTDGTNWVDVSTEGAAVGIESVTKDKVDENGATYTITYTDGTTKTITIAEPAGSGDGESGGCNGSLESTFAIVGATLFVTAAAVVALPALRKRGK